LKSNIEPTINLALIKKFANKIFLFIVVFFDFNIDFAINNNKFFDNNIDNKISIDTTIVTKISLNKKSRFIINKIASCCKYYLLNKRFKII